MREAKQQGIVKLFQQQRLTVDRIRAGEPWRTARCGFGFNAVYADYEKSPYGSTYPGELIIVAKKPYGIMGM